MDKEILKLKSEKEEDEENNNNLSDSLTKCKVENGELLFKIERLEEDKKQLQESINQDDSSQKLATLNIRLQDLEDENKKLRKTVNDLNETESNLQTEIGQYKLNLDRIKREHAQEKEKEDEEKELLLQEATRSLEDFSAEKHLIKAKIKKLLIEY